MDKSIESTIIERLNFVDDKIDIDESNLTPIQEFYKDTKIFVTGCTGFLGQILVEKLLRSCPVSTIYLLVRSKKGKDTNDRLKEMFDDKLFDRMRKACPNFQQKIVAVEGDCILPDLGLSELNKKILINEVNIIFHVAATVRFDEKLKTAAAVNVRAARDLCFLAQKMPRLKSFVQVSTAFSNCVNNVIEERVYPSPMKYSHLLELTEVLDNLLLEHLSPHFIGKYPNTYIYTKQIAEGVLKEKTQGLPVGIYRPAIVVSTYKEPIRGWINNIYGPTGFFYGAGLGLLRVLYCDGNSDANLIPVDMCINGLIASAWDVAENFQKSKTNNEEFQLRVYNYESTNDQRINWADFRYMSSKYGSLMTSVHNVWIYFLVFTKSYAMYLVLAFLLHWVPAMILDAIMYCIGKKLRLLQTYKKIHTFSSVLAYFSIRSFKFNSANVRKMLDRMSKKDLEVFFCDIKKLDWNDFFITYGPGARIYLAKDPLETLPEARKIYRRLQWRHRAVKTVLGLLGATLLWYMVSAICRFIY